MRCERTPRAPFLLPAITTERPMSPAFTPHCGPGLRPGEEANDG